MVKACVTQGTHHVDISGEPQFLETMQLKYNDEAEKKGIYIVGSCGFDSIPSDLGKQARKGSNVNFCDLRKIYFVKKIDF